MIYKFSEASKNALENAEKIAVELGHIHIGTELFKLLSGCGGEAFGIVNTVDI